jgi:hypothetical protein
LYLCDIPYPLRIGALIFFLVLLVNPWRRWINLLIEGQPEPPKRPAVRWPLRPSNLLILLGVGFYTYWGVYEPCPAPRFPFFCGVIVTVLAFVVRRWEDASVRE